MELQFAFKGKYDDPAFIAGFEAGLIWQAFENNEVLEECLIRNVNVDIIKQMSMKFLYEIEFTKLDDTWSYIWAFPSAQQN